MNQEKAFYGKYKEQMPSLIQEGLTPYTFRDVMQKRVEALNSKNAEQIEFWLNQYFYTSTGLAYHDGNLIVIQDSDLLKSINSNSGIKDHSLILTPEQYNKLSKQYEVIKRNKVKIEKSLTKEEAKNHKLWLNLSGNDQALLNEYADLIFAEAKKTYKYDENMGVYLPNDQKDPALRAWCAGSLVYGSGVDGRYGFDRDYVRLFGVRAQNLEALLGTKALELGMKDPIELGKAIELYLNAKKLVQQ